jgi:hypothetical protein
MKAKIKFSQLVMVTLLCLFSLAFLPGCKKKLLGNKDSLTGCNLVKIKGLWNCEKDKCIGRCVLQIKKPGKDWRDIPGGNVDPNDVPASDTLRCVCRDTSKKTD